MPVVAPAHERTFYGMPETGARGACSLVEIARVLAKHRRQDGAAEKRADRYIRVGSAETLAVAGRPLPVAAERILRLFDSCDETDASESKRVQIRSPGEFHFLFCVQRSGIWFVRDIEIRNDAKDALLFLLFDLNLSDFDGGNANANLGCFRGNREGDLRNRKGFSGAERGRDGLRCKTVRGDGDGVIARSNIGEGKLAVIAGLHFVAGRLTDWSEGYFCAGNEIARLIEDFPFD